MTPSYCFWANLASARPTIASWRSVGDARRSFATSPKTRCASKGRPATRSELASPIFVSVAEGRVRGAVDHPIASAVPKFNGECKAYYLPDGRAVIPRPDGTLIPTAAPACDAGIQLAPAAPEQPLAQDPLGPTSAVDPSLR